MRNIYICHTNYHLLLSLIKLNIEDTNDIVVFDDIINVDRIIENIKEYCPQIQIYMRKNSIYSKFKKISFKTNKVRKLLLEEIEYFKNFNNIYIFNDFTRVGVFLHQYKIEYNLIEDGYNYFSFVKKEKVNIKILLNYILKDIPLPRGNSKYCQSIEVNDMSVVPKGERYYKFKEVPRKDLFNNISEERKQLILRVFDVAELSEVEDKSILILTQPLSIDGLMNSDEKQYGFYKKICDKYLSEGYQVYLKPHPRDTITYEKINGVSLIAQTVPMELIEMVSDVKFELIITHSSTAINFLTCGEEKEVFYDFNTQEYDKKFLEKYKINKDEL